MPYNPKFYFGDLPGYDAKIWRYMEFIKLLSILENNSLYFSRLDKLAEVDPFEGTYPRLNIEYPKKEFEELPDEFISRMGLTSKAKWDGIRSTDSGIIDCAKRERELTFVSCWHVQEYESAFMWNMYSKNTDGIAIQTTFDKLCKSFKNYQEYSVFISKIYYIDYDKQAIEMNNGLYSYVHKRLSYKHENELRALIWTVEKENTYQNNIYKEQSGLLIPIDIKCLIENIYVSPIAPDWVVKQISDVCRRYGVLEPKHSKIGEIPFN